MLPSTTSRTNWILFLTAMLGDVRQEFFHQRVPQIPRMLQFGGLELLQVAFEDRNHFLVVNFRDSFLNANNLANQPIPLRTSNGGRKNWWYRHRSFPVVNRPLVTHYSGGLDLCQYLKSMKTKTMLEKLQKLCARSREL
ncbi:MAG: hypothetical protein ACLQU1_29755 [Bryobacteraceae bacterium]